VAPTTSGTLFSEPTSTAESVASSCDFHSTQRQSCSPTSSQNQFILLLSITRSNVPAISKLVYPSAFGGSFRSYVTVNRGKSARVFRLLMPAPCEAMVIATLDCICCFLSRPYVIVVNRPSHNQSALQPEGRRVQNGPALRPPCVIFVTRRCAKVTCRRPAGGHRLFAAWHWSAKPGFCCSRSSCSARRPWPASGR